MRLIRRQNSANERPAASAFNGSSDTRLAPSAPSEGEGTTLIVPTALFPILCAMFVLLVIHHAMVLSSEIVIWIPTAADEPLRGARGISPEFANPSTQTMIVASMLRSATQHAAFTAFSYVVISHFTLRWLGLTSVTAYGVGGLCASFAVAAYWSVLGYRLPVDSLVLDLACGAIAGVVYRLIAGRKRAAGLLGLPEGEAGGRSREKEKGRP
jgi:hypothetical protein